MANMLVPTGLDTEEAIKAQIARAQLMRNTLPSSEGQAVGPLRVMSVGSPLAGLIQGFDADYRERQALDALKVLNENRQKAIDEEIGKMPGGGVEDQPDLTGLGGSEGGGGILPPTPDANPPSAPINPVSGPVSGAAALPGSVAASQGASPSSAAAPTGAVAPSLMLTPGAPGGPLAGSQGALPAAVRAMNPEAQADAVNRWASRFATLRAPTDSKFNPAAIANAGIEAAISQPGKAADRRTQLAGQLAVAAANAEARSLDKQLGIEAQERARAEANQWRALGMSLAAQGRVETARHNREMEDLARGKVEDKQAAADRVVADRNRLLDQTYNNINNTLDRLISPEGKMNPDLDKYVGQINQYVPDAAMKEDTRAAGSALETLQEQMTMLNLAEAKQAVGQSFGSMQVKEWDKFMNQVVNLKRGLPGKTIERNLNEIRTYIKTHKDVLKTAMSAGAGVPPPAAPGGYDADKEARYQAWKRSQGMQ